MYKVGDKVVYPHHGAGTVVKKEKRDVLGEKREYLTIKILHNDMTVNVPSENAEKVGLRKVIGEDMVKVVVKALTGGGTQMPKNWNRRFKHNRDKMKTGDILELAEVVRNLSLRDVEKGLSTGEKQMFVKAKKILASELMYAKDMDEEEAAEWLDGVLVGSSTNGASNGRKKTTAAKPAKVASKTHEARCSEDGGEARRREEQADDEGARHLEVSVWAVLAAAGSGERLGADRPKAFVRLGEQPLLAESLARLDASGLDRRNRRRGSSRVGGAGDPARRGARLRQGERLRRRGSDPCRLGPARVSPRFRQTPRSSSSTTPRGRFLEDAVVERVVDRARRGLGRGRAGPDRLRHGQAGRGRAHRRDAAPAMSCEPCRRRRHSSRTCCAAR